jgi:hypothetical protein
VSDPLLSAQRSLIRVAVVAVLLVVATAVFARYMTRKSSRGPSRETTVTFGGALRADVERSLEARSNAASAGGTWVCATAFAGADAATSVAGRRRIFVRALCRELCVMDGIVGGGTAAGFPAAVAVVRHDGGWHVVGHEVPTDAHFERDMTAIFPSSTRQNVYTEDLAKTADARIEQRARDRWPTARFLPDSASCIGRPGS